MSEQPKDYFLGALDFFGILVPGAVVIVFLRLQNRDLATLISGAMEFQGNQGFIAFLVAAYLAGYLINMTSLILDHLTGSFQHRLYERSEGRDLYNRASELLKQNVSHRDRSLIGVYAWACASVRDRSPLWRVDIDRLDAHTALFRGMCFVFAITGLFEFRHLHPIRGILGLVGAGLCFWIFKHLRWQRIGTVYKYFIYSYSGSSRPTDQSNLSEGLPLPCEEGLGD
jgi:hypothetical protein